jgi:predicted acylesterase/phospholipase RssA
MVHHRNFHGNSAMTGRFRRSRRETAGLAEPHTIKTVSLALQGGGAHGALTWGVLDALLEDGRLGVEAITGASAGAMNAVVLVQGWLEGGIEGARSRLEPSGARRASARPVPRPNADSSTWCWASGTTRPGWT